MWPKFCNSSISMKKDIITSIWYEFDQKNQFFWGMFLVQAQWLGASTRYGLEILHKSEVSGTNSYVCRSYRLKTGRSLFALPE